MPADTATQTLTPTETKILQAIADGYMHKNMPDVVGCSESTSKNHMTHVLKKLEAQSQAQAVAKAMRQGLIH